MPIWSRRWPFLDYTVDAAPLDAGVYALWKDEELVYIGASNGDNSSIRARLKEHLSGTHGDYTRSADHYSWEVAADPRKREMEVLEQFRRKHGRLPRFNEKS